MGQIGNDVWKQHWRVSASSACVNECEWGCKLKRRRGRGNALKCQEGVRLRATGHEGGCSEGAQVLGIRGHGPFRTALAGSEPHRLMIISKLRCDSLPAPWRATSTRSRVQCHTVQRDLNARVPGFIGSG